MHPHYRYPHLIAVLLAGLLAASCSASPSRENLRAGHSIELTSYADPLNQVLVSIQLTYAKEGNFQLSATFTPPEGFHLYGKDLPRGGLRGQGRPTLLELADGSKMQPAGNLAESVPSGLSGYQPDGPLVYPIGPVTLMLPVSLPEGTGWLPDTVSLTYMPCTATICLAPVVGKLVTVTIPRKGSTSQ